MSKIALMQPYLFPYLGYFQLISAVDTFLIYDDVQWMKGGWINRNRMLVSGRPEWFTLSVKKDSLGTQIRDREFSEKFEAEKRVIAGKFAAAYRGAPFLQPTLELVSECFQCHSANVREFTVNALARVCEVLGIATEISVSSELEKTDGLRGQDRVIDICQRLGATEYVNAVGGIDLYDPESFNKAGLDLSFIQSGPLEYRQFDEPFVPNLSIIDTLMFNSVENVQTMVRDHELIGGETQ